MARLVPARITLDNGADRPRRATLVVLVLAVVYLLRPIGLQLGVRACQKLHLVVAADSPLWRLLAIERIRAAPPAP